MRAKFLFFILVFFSLMNAPQAASLALAQGASDLRDFEDYDLDNCLRDAKPMSKDGLDIFYKFYALHFQATLAAKPSLWSEGEKLIEHIHTIKMFPVSGDQFRYSLTVKTKKGKKVVFHLGNSIAEAILDDIQKDGEQCCIGNIVDIYAEYVYNTQGKHGLIAIQVYTYRRGKVTPPT